jgi:hypothetical protein
VKKRRVRRTRGVRPSTALLRRPATVAAPKFGEALVRLDAAETLAAGYGAWAELNAARASAAAERTAERERLTREAGYLLGAIEKARAVRIPSARASRALAKRDPMGAIQDLAEEERRLALKALEERERREEAHFETSLSRIRGTIQKRARTLLGGRSLSLAITVQPVGTDRAVVHANRLGETEAVLLCLLFSGKLPTRWGFYSDDAVEDLALGPPLFYADEGMTDTRPSSSEEEDAVIDRPGEFAPLRMHIPLRLPDRPFPRFRMVHRGPETEVESRRNGERYSQLIPREDAEIFTGYLLRLKVEGMLEMTVSVG